MLFLMHAESKLLSAQLDSLKKPLKSIFFTNGPASAVSTLPSSSVPWAGCDQHTLLLCQ
jgi:hypothetical protein